MSGAGEHLSGADAAWLHMDRPTNLMVINSVLLFDERLDWDRLTEIVRTRLVERYPRFHQRVLDSRIDPRGPRWQDCADFELSRHMHRRGLPEPGDEAALKLLAGDLAATPLDRGKPLWEMYLIDGPGRGSAVIVRMHHCIADGIALAAVMLSLTDSSPGPQRPDRDLSPDPDGARKQTEGLGRRLAAAAGDALSSALRPAAATVSATRRLAQTLEREGTAIARDPGRAVELAGTLGADARALAKLVLTPGDAPSVLKGDLGAARSVAWSRPVSLARVKAIAHAQGATVNDVLLAAVSGALHDYLLSRGEQPHEIRTLVPVNLRPLAGATVSELGNRFGLVYLTLPVDRSSRRERLRELKLRMDEIKDSPEGPVSYTVLEAVGLTPPELESRFVDIFTAKATAVTTNVPGPRETVYLAGAPLRAVLVWAPTAGSVGMSICIFSYDGEITVGVLVHSGVVGDPEAIVEPLAREIAALARLSPTVQPSAR